MLLLWLARTLSFFNTIALLWLGLTVLLNVERRRAGTWLTGGGLLLGGGFFVAHTILLGREPALWPSLLDFWLVLGWWVLLLSPVLWYLVIAWYSGHLRSVATAGCMAGFAALGGLLLVALPWRIGQPAGLATAPPLWLAYPAFSVACIGLALLWLHRPASSDRLMGDLARQRAHPWLVAASAALLLVGPSVAGLVTVVAQSGGGAWPVLLAFDAAIAAEAGLAVVLSGRAIVAYEVFTGRALPRRGLLRHWRNSLILATGYGSLVSGALALPVSPIYPLVLATLLVAAFYALLSWRLFEERERSLENLRSFVTGEQSYAHLAHEPGLALDLAAPLSTLCEQTLEARALLLVPLGAFATLAGRPIGHPAGVAAPAMLPDVAGWRPDGTCVALPPGHPDGWRWAVPLWTGRELMGVLLLAEKRDGGLYTEEEMEVARAAGERLVDTLATAELTRRLMRLERERLAESQLLDQRTRRTLHDDVLPLLQTAMLHLNAGTPPAEAIALLGDAHHRIAGLLRELPSPFSAEVARLGALGALRRAIDGELGDIFAEVTWAMEEAAEKASWALSPLTAEVLFAAAREVARNAARHGRGDGDDRPLRLHVAASLRDGLVVSLTDDGVGFAAGSSDGGGQGLSLYGTMLAVIGGSLTVDVVPRGTRVVLWVPAGAEGP